MGRTRIGTQDFPTKWARCGDIGMIWWARHSDFPWFRDVMQLLFTPMLRDSTFFSWPIFITLHMPFDVVLARVKLHEYPRFFSSWLKPQTFIASSFSETCDVDLEEVFTIQNLLACNSSFGYRIQDRVDHISASCPLQGFDGFIPRGILPLY